VGTKIKCLQCGDIIEGDKRGHCLSCSCGACYIDETPYYYRIGGDYSKINIFDEDGNEKLLKDIVPIEQTVIDKPKITRREWMNKMSDENLADFIIKDLPNIYNNYTDSISGLAKWFKEEIEEE